MESPDIASFPVPPDSTLVPHPRPALALDCSRAVLCPCRFIVGPGDEGHLVRKVILKHSDRREWCCFVNACVERTAIFDLKHRSESAGGTGEQSRGRLYRALNPSTRGHWAGQGRAGQDRAGQPWPMNQGVWLALYSLQSLGSINVKRWDLKGKMKGFWR